MAVTARRSSLVNREPPSRKRVEAIILLEEVIENPTISQQELANKYGISRSYISMLLKDEGITAADMRVYKNAYRAELKEARTRLTTLILQYCFNKGVEEKGIDHALAWRVREVYRVGKSYSLESLERLINARRQGVGFRRCVKLAGWARERDEIGRHCPEARRILNRALEDIEYPRVSEEFGARKYFTQQEEEQELVRLSRAGASRKEIAQRLGVPESAVYYHKKRLGFPNTRRSPNVDKGRVLQLLSRGVEPRDIHRVTGFSSTSYYRWKKQLDNRTITPPPREASRSRYGDDPLSYYLCNHADKTKSQLRSSTPELYELLHQSGDLQFVKG